MAEAKTDSVQKQTKQLFQFIEFQKKKLKLQLIGFNNITSGLVVKVMRLLAQDVHNQALVHHALLLF